MTPAERALLWEVLGMLLSEAFAARGSAFGESAYFAILLRRLNTARADAEREREG